MINSHTSRLMVIFLFVFAVLSIGLGLSLFGNSLSIATNIREFNDKNFKVDFTSNSINNNLDNVLTSDIIPERNVEGFSANPANIDNIGDPLLKDIKVTFTEPGQAASYSLFSSNIGSNLAYLKGIIFENVENETNYLVCRPIDTTTKELVDSACKDVELSIEVGTSGEQHGSITSIKNHTLEPKKSEKINIIITYKLNATRTDGPFVVEVGDLSLLYSSNE